MAKKKAERDVKEVYYNVWVEVEKVTVYMDGEEDYQDLAETEGDDYTRKVGSFTELADAVNVLDDLEYSHDFDN